MKKLSPLLAITALLTACGGGGTPPTSANEKPLVSIKRADGTIITTTTFLAPTENILINSSDSDGNITKVQWTIDGTSGEFSGTEVKSKLLLPLSGLTSGSHSVSVTVTDNGGATATASTTFAIDSTPPSFSSVTFNTSAVSSGSTFSLSTTDAAVLKVTATDSRGSGNTAYSPTTIQVLEGSTVRATGTDSLSVDLSKTADGKDRAAGNVTFTVQATDSAGLTTSRSFTLSFTAASTDTTKPTFTWLAPTIDYVKGGSSVTLRATAFRNNTDLSSSITYSATCGTVTGNVWNLDASCADGSKQTVTATLVSNGSTFTDSKTVTIDASDPTVQITSPNAGTVISVNPVKVSVVATDAGSGVATVLVEASRDGGAYEQVGVLAGASGDITWAPSNGTYSLRATATDKTGRTSTTSISNIKVQLTSSDNQAPVVTALDIPAGVQRGVVTITTTVTDPAPSSGVAKVELFDGGISLGTQTSGVGGQYTFSVDTSKLTDGTHTIRAVATDNVGLTGQLSKTLQSDNTKPVVTWNSPTEGALTKKTVTLNATTNEGTVSYMVDGVAVSDTDTTLPGLQVQLADGNHTLTATATDAAGNVTTSNITVTTDGTAPTAQIISPTTGTNISSNPVSISVSGNDNMSGVSGLEVFANGTSIGSVTGSSGTISWVPTNGTYALTVVATDKAGNKSTPTQTVNVQVQLATADTTAPVFPSDPTVQPTPQNTFSHGSVVIDGLVNDPESGISQVALFDGGNRLSVTPSLSKQPDGSTRYSFTLDTTTLSDGQHTLVIQATNSVGLVTNKNLIINVKNTASGLTWNAPSIVGSSGSLTLNATSSDGSAVTYTATCGTVSGSVWNYAACPDGSTATITASTTNAAGITTTATRTITIDLTAPLVQLTSPTEGQKFTQNPVSVSVSATDNLAIDRIEILDGSTKVGMVTGAQGTVSWVASNGTHTLTAVAYDKAGNKTSSTPVNISVTLTSSSVITPNAPTVTGKTSGTNPIFINGLGTVSGSATSTSGIASGQLMVDGQTSGTATAASNGTPVSFNFDFNSLNEGLHDLGLRWADNAGVLADSAKLSVYVDKTAPTLTWNSPKTGTVTRTAPITLNATATDAGSGVAGVSYSVDGQTVPSSWTPAAEGAYTVTATASDNVGNSSSQTTSVTYDKSGPVITATSPANAQEFTGNTVAISATATDNLTGVQSMEASVTAPDGTVTTLGRQQGASYTASYTPVSAGTYSVSFTALDNAGNAASTVTRSFVYSVTTPPIEKAPAPVLSVVGTSPFSGNMSVSVSGNFDTNSQVDRMILQITDSQGVVDNTTYTTTQAQATFSVDTTKFANGNLKLEVIAYTKSGLRGSSAPTTVEIKNLNSPELAVASPANGATVNSPNVPVRVTLTKRGADYTLPSTIQVDILDYRGVVVLQKTLNTADSAICTGDTASLTCNTQFDMAGLPADTYTIRASTSVVVDPAGTNQTRALETNSRFTSNTQSVLPPAATIRFPAITNQHTPARIDSQSGFLVTVSDDTGVKVVEARVVGPFDAAKPLALNGTTQCQESQPMDLRSPVDVLLLNYGLNPIVALGDIVLPNFDIDGSAYVPNNKSDERYDIRVTTVDAEGNRNIQCIPITIDREKTKTERVTYTTSATTTPVNPDPTPGKLNYTAGTWTISGMTNSSRVAGVVYVNGVQKSVSFNANVSGSTSISMAFADEGTYHVVWLIEDMNTGIVTSQPGSYINVKRNPTGG